MSKAKETTAAEAVETTAEKTAALNDLEKTYADMTSKSDQFYDKKINASKDWAKEQTKLQNQQTDFAIQKIEQQKDQAKKDYTKEQSGAYVDWQKQSNQYGANAEQRASIGMTGTGYSESAQVSMYNTYQNRVATARESYNQTIMNYNNNIAEAKLQNSSILAEIAYNAQKEQLELALAGFQDKNQLLLDKVDKKTTLEQNYYQRYRDVINQINTENALAEEVRQYNATLAHQQAQLAEEKRQFNILHPATTGGTSGGSSGGYIKGTGYTGRSGDNKGSKSGSKISGSSSASASAKKSGLPGSSAMIDLSTVLSATGKGPISAKTLSEKVDEGRVKPSLNNGVLTFTPSIESAYNRMNYAKYGRKPLKTAKGSKLKQKDYSK